MQNSLRKGNTLKQRKSARRLPILSHDRSISFPDRLKMCRGRAQTSAYFVLGMSMISTIALGKAPTKKPAEIELTSHADLVLYLTPREEAGVPLKDDGVYLGQFMIATQKIKGGYVIYAQPPGYPPRGPAIFRTKVKIDPNKQFCGTFHYVARAKAELLNGFDKDVPVFEAPSGYEPNTPKGCGHK